jgi:hypothetical protein
VRGDADENGAEEPSRLVEHRRGGDEERPPARPALPLDDVEQGSRDGASRARAREPRLRRHPDLPAGDRAAVDVPDLHVAVDALRAERRARPEPERQAGRLLPRPRERAAQARALHGAGEESIHGEVGATSRHPDDLPGLGPEVGADLLRDHRAEGEEGQHRARKDDDRQQRREPPDPASVRQPAGDGEGRGEERRRGPRSPGPGQRDRPEEKSAEDDPGPRRTRAADPRERPGRGQERHDAGQDHRGGESDEGDGHLQPGPGGPERLGSHVVERGVEDHRPCETAEADPDGERRREARRRREEPEEGTAPAGAVPVQTEGEAGEQGRAGRERQGGEHELPGIAEQASEPGGGEVGRVEQIGRSDRLGEAEGLQGHAQGDDDGERDGRREGLGEPPAEGEAQDQRGQDRGEGGPEGGGAGALDEPQLRQVRVARSRLDRRHGDGAAVGQLERDPDRLLG